MSGDQIGTGSYATPEQQAKKKRLKWILIGIALTIVVVLAIVLPIVLTKSSSSPDDPTPPGPGPDPDPHHTFSNETIYNPYNVSVYVDSQNSIDGFISSPKPYDPKKHLAAYMNMVEASTNLSSPHNFTTLPHHFPVGLNNEFVGNLSYSFYMTDYHVAALEITDPLKERYDVPEEAVKKPGKNPTMRLEMMGLKVFHEPFAFQFYDIRDESNVFLHTNYSTLVFLDKFI